MTDSCSGWLSQKPPSRFFFLPIFLPFIFWITHFWLCALPHGIPTELS